MYQILRFYHKVHNFPPLSAGLLVLLPTSTSKLLAKWQGPYVVMAREGLVTYEVDKGERRKWCRTYHVNTLQPWYEKGEKHYG